MNLDLIALQNLEILSHHDNKTHFIEITDKIKLESKEREKDYENVSEINEIEYPLYFTFNHTFLLFNNAELSKSRKYIIQLMQSALDNIYNTYGDFNNERLIKILDHIDDVIEIINNNYHKYYCYYKIKNMYYYLLSGFSKSMFIMNEMNKSIYGQYEIDSDEEDDSYDSDDSDNYNTTDDDSDKED